MSVGVMGSRAVTAAVPLAHRSPNGTHSAPSEFRRQGSAVPQREQVIDRIASTGLPPGAERLDQDGGEARAEVAVRAHTKQTRQQRPALCATGSTAAPA